MKIEKLEVIEYSPPSAPIIRMPGRNFPGYLIAGDNLNNLVKIALEVKHSVRKAEQEPESFSRAQQANLVSDVQRISAILCRMLAHYESVLTEHNIELPYDPPLKMRVSDADLK
jgi:hypothetical protein